jgi:hypothetical protein
MSYSRRQLYAFGEPLGDSVTRKEGGRIVYGGGGGQSSSGTSTQVSDLPEWAKGYAKDTLSKTAAVTDISQNPYKPYEANRIAGFSPLQQQSQQNAANMQTSGVTGFGTQLAGAAGLGALGARYDPTQFQADQFGGDAAQRYMSPYMQNVVDIQQREAQRQGDIAGTQLASQATKSGAFGGGRQAIMQAEAARNLAQQKGDIQARGLQSSYEQAQAQFNADQARRMQAQQLAEQSKQYGAGYGMQGLQTALQGAGQLGALGGQQFAQGMDINKLQNAYGGQQQALEQQGLTQAYQDFQNQQNYPYKQLGFMSDMINRLPLGQQSTRQVYEPEPGGLQQLGALGAGVYGLSKFMAEGGMAYADGGSVDSPGNVASIVKSLSPEQLEQALEAAQARGDIDQVEAIQTEMAMRASLSNGIAGAVTPQMADDMTTQYAAKGGILAFQDRGVVDSDAAADDEDEKQSNVGAVNPSLLQQYYAANKALAAFKPTPAMTEAERAAFEQKEFDRRLKFAGEDPYAPMAEKFKQFEADRTKNYDRGLGLAALQAIPKILKGGSAIRGLGEGAGAFGEGVSQLDKADAAEKRALASMDFNLKDAQRKERMGLTKDAMASFTDAQKDKIAADKARLEALKAAVRSTTDAGRAFRAPAAGKPGAGPKLAEQLAEAEIAHETNPTDASLKKVTALRRAVLQTKTTDVGATRAELARMQVLSGENKAVQAAMNKFQFNPVYLDALNESPAKAAEVYQAELDKQRKLFPAAPSAGGDVNKNSSPPARIKFDAKGEQIK